MSAAWLYSFSQAWDMLLDIPVPALIRKKLSDTDEFEEDENGSMVLSGFPLIGAFLGLSAYLLARFLLFFPGGLAASLIAALLITFGLELASSGRGLSAISSFFENFFESRDSRSAMLEMDDDFTSSRSSIGILTLVSIFILRLTCFWMLIDYGLTFWLIPVLTAGYAVQAHLAQIHASGTDEPIIEASSNNPNLPWFIAAGIIIVTSWSCLPAAVAAIAISYLFAWKAGRFLEDKTEGVTPILVGTCGYMTEIIILLSGAILLIRN